jgi:cyclophilin family peptidyl-prolyl cis-trans isomerase
MGEGRRVSELGIVLVVAAMTGQGCGIGQATKASIETSKGTIVVELYPREAPKTVQNFVKLAKSGYYNGMLFHRVIPGFMIQTGDPTGTGSGGPGYSFEDEISPRHKHDAPGVLSMANSGPNTNGSQFFITLKPTSWLDGKHTIFGRVVEGQIVAQRIAEAERDANDRPISPVKMVRVTIED